MQPVISDLELGGKNNFEQETIAGASVSDDIHIHEWRLSSDSDSDSEPLQSESECKSDFEDNW